MGHRRAEELKALRAAVFRADGSVVELLAGQLTPDILQLAGDGLIDALAAGQHGAPELAAQCMHALSERHWDGDDLLEDQLRGALGKRLPRSPRPLYVDLESLASMLEGDPLQGGCRVDLQTGDCWPVSDE